MTLTQPQEAPHRRTHAASTAARIGQFTGALPALGGVAALAPRRLAGARAGLTGPVMASTFRAHPPGLLAIAAHGGLAAGPSMGAGPRGQPSGGAGDAWTGRHQASSRDIPRYPWVRRGPGR
jgi:hypothetical protein